MVLAPGLNVVVPKLTVVPAGFKLADNVIEVENPFKPPVFNVVVPLLPAQIATGG